MTPDKNIRKALWVTPATHYALKKMSADKQMTFEELMQFFLKINVLDLKSPKIR